MGVPVYPVNLFEQYFLHFPHDEIKLCEVLTKDNLVVSSLILLQNNKLAIDAFSASMHDGVRLRANDFMIYNLITYCQNQGIEKLDFGADSPLQESLIAYKTKWLGNKREIVKFLYQQCIT